MKYQKYPSEINLSEKVLYKKALLTILYFRLDQEIEVQKCNEIGKMYIEERYSFKKLLYKVKTKSSANQDARNQKQG